MTFHTQSKNGNKIKRDFKRFKAKRNRESERLRNSPHFCVFKTARAVKQKVWNEAENRERDWGETLKIGACEARALRARKTLTPDFTRISLLILRKKNRLFCSLRKRPMLPSFEEGTENKSANEILTQRDLQSSLEGKKLIERFKLQNEVKKKPKRCSS